MGIFEILKKKPQEDRKSSLARAPRVKLSALKHIKFNNTEIANISTSGLALFKGDKAWPNVGQILDGQLCIENETITTKVRIIRFTESIVGAAFVAVDPHLTSVINRFFKAELSATKMTRINPEMLKQDPDGTPECFVGEQNELYILTKDQEWIYFTLTFLGHYMEGRRGKPLKYGQIADKERTGSLQYNESSVVRLEPKASDEIITISINFLNNIAELDSKLLEAITKYIRS